MFAWGCPNSDHCVTYFGGFTYILEWDIFEHKTKSNVVIASFCKYNGRGSW